MTEYHPKKDGVIISTEKLHKNLLQRGTYIDMPHDDKYHILRHKCQFSHTHMYMGDIYYNYVIIDTVVVEDFNDDWSNA